MIDSQQITREIDKILAREGSEYTNYPADRGGPTKFGITQQALRDFWRTTDPVYVERLTEDDARRIYRDLYIHAPGFDAITDPRLFSLVVDSGVQHGTGTATRWLQAALGVTADGVLGAVTRGALENAHSTILTHPDYPDSRIPWAPDPIYKHVIATRLRHYAQQCVDHPNQLVFLRGWTERMIPFIDEMELPT